MKVDYHIHLEEGPYSLSFVEKTIKAIDSYEPIHEKQGTKEWLMKTVDLMSKRLETTEYSKWWLDFYLEEALKKGIKEVGIVDHLYRFKETRSYFTKYMDVTSNEIGIKQAKWLDQVMVRNLNEFVELITSQKAAWAEKGVKLKLGIEADYFSGGEEELTSLLDGYDFDYVIGSVHFNQGWGFDNPKLKHHFEKNDLHALYQNHFATVKNAASSGLFDFIAHLDNLKVFNYRPDESRLFNMYQDVAETLAHYDIATEVNPGLYYRYPVKEMCPSSTFLDILISEGVKFTMSSDSHYPNDLGIYSDRIKAMLLEKGVSEIATFDKRKRNMQSLL
ncbi:histidinol phosphate phosphatase domain-containing protein [Oceanobacillus piezotolerans]|uniref:Histidinol-phosphatase n=1 Tax=Oceanobacillus piezotolerans TaxID=2448030 RepID=A0A498D8K8_9BACI|nr:histidinol phosphate phosphatase domain-containing protein [Oceanobacillus piezotolerans]RLL46723.1 histidinol phosphate phosphatase domain-containing protein [Oceanobacillus piezotolerans]